MLVLDVLVLAVRVLVSGGVPVKARLVDTVVVAEAVFVAARVAVPQGLCVVDFELLVEEL